MFFHQTDQYNHKGKCRTFPRAQDGPLSAHLAVEPDFGHDEQEGHNRVLPYPPPSIPPLSYSSPSFPSLPFLSLFPFSHFATFSANCQKTPICQGNVNYSAGFVDLVESMQDIPGIGTVMNMACLHTTRSCSRLRRLQHPVADW
jgi:hypothetical protein